MTIKDKGSQIPLPLTEIDFEDTKESNGVIGSSTKNYETNGDAKSYEIEPLIETITKEKDVLVEEKITKSKSVGILELFSFTDKWDVFLIILGLIGSLITGLLFPYMVSVFGDISSGFTNYQVQHELLGCDSSCGTNDECQVIDDLLKSHMSTVMWQYCAIGVTMWICQYLTTVALQTTATRQVTRIRAKFLGSILRQDMTWFDTNTTADFASKMTEDLNRIQDGIGEKMGMLVQYIVTFLGSMIYPFTQNWLISLVMLSALPLMAFFGGLMFFIMSRVSKDEMETYGKAGAIAEEVFSAIRTVIAFGGEKKELNRYTAEVASARKNGIIRNFLTGLSGGLTFFVIYSIYGLGLWYGVKSIKDEEETDEFKQCFANCTSQFIDHGDAFECIEGCRKFTVGSITIALFGILQGGMQLGQSGPFAEAFNTARVAAYDIYYVIFRRSNIDSSSTDGIKPAELKGEISFKSVFFNYPARKEVKVLNGFSLDIESGKTVALVGSSGCGKSTCIQLIQRFYDPDQGEIFVDGTNIKALNVAWLRNNIGIVGQEPVLFDCTIKDNIRYAKEDASDEEIANACNEANAFDFIQKLPKQFDTLVGEGGMQLSGGQKQRIAIARALIRNPKILLLDEATSALDNESEGIVQSAIERVHAGRTTLVVAHRLSTIKNADLIVAIKEDRKSVV